MWKERNKKTSDRVKNVDAFDLLKIRWFQMFGLLLLSHHLHSMEDLGNSIDTLRFFLLTFLFSDRLKTIWV